MANLAPNEEQVLQLRFSGTRLRTHAEVAAILAVPVDKVLQIEFQALRKLRLKALGRRPADANGWDEV